jgi:hypothetical protein
MRMIRNKKAQEEMVGFVLIMVIVAIIFLVFLGIFVRNKAPTENNDARDLYQFVSSVMEYTTNCVVSEPSYSKVGELIEQCYDNELCSDGNNSCVVLNSTLQSILNASRDMLNVGEDRPYSGYLLNVTYTENVSSGRTSKNILLEGEGNCSSKYRGSTPYLIPAYPGTIVTSFRVCY